MDTNGSQTTATACAPRRHGHRRHHLRRPAGRVTAGLALTGMAAALPLVLGAAPATAAGSFSPGTVTIADPTVGAFTDYSVPFTTSDAGALGAGGTITLTAPDGTVFPSGASAYAIAVNNGGGAGVSSVAVSAVTGPGADRPSATDNQVVITLGPLSIVAAGDTATVTVTGMTNPTLASTTDVMDESTSSDTAPTASPAYSITPGPIAEIVATAGDNQQASSNGTFPVDLSATVTDVYGNPVPTSGVSVTFTAPSSGPSGAFAGGCASNPQSNECVNKTDSSGVATASTLSDNATTGSYQVTASISSPSSSATFNLTNVPFGTSVTPGTMSLSKTGGGADVEGATGVGYSVPFTVTSAIPPSGSTCATTTCSITLTAPNGTSFSSSVSSYSVTNNLGVVQVVATATTSMVPGPGAATSDPACADEQGTLSGRTCTSTTPNQVVLTFTSVATSMGAGGTDTVVANAVTNPDFASSRYVMDESTSSDTLPAPSPAYTITVGPPASLTVVSGSPQATEVSTAFAQPLVTEVTDSGGNPLGGTQVQYTIGSSGGGSPASAVFSNGTTTQIATTGTDGQAQPSVPTANGNPGQYTVTATVNALSAVFTLANTTPPGTTGTVTLSPATAGAGPGTSPATPVTYLVPFTTTAHGALGPGATLTLVAPNGTVFAACATASACSGYSVTDATSGHSATVGSVAVAAVPGPGARITDPACADEQGTLSANTCTSTTDNEAIVTLSASTVAAGDALTITVGGASNPDFASSGYTLDVSSSADQTPAPSPAYAVVPGPAAQTAVVTGSPQSAPVGQAFATPLSAAVEDAFGNPVPTAGVQVTFAAPSSPASGTFASGCVSNPQPNECVATTDAGGVATASILSADDTPGTYFVSASAGALTGASFELTNLTVLSPASVTLSPDTAAATSTYTVPFSTGAQGQIPAEPQAGQVCPSGCTITLVAPDGTTFPSSAGSYSIAVDDAHAATVAGVALSTVAGPGSSSASTTANQVVVSLGTSSIGAGDTVTLTITGVTNPTPVATGYKMDESTSSEQVAQASPPYFTGGPYTPLIPIRICDTRPGNPSGLSGAQAQCNGGSGNPGLALAAGDVLGIGVTGSAFGVPTDASAVVLNVTVVNPAAPGYLTVYPAAANPTPPTASNVNYVAGQVVANLVEVGVGAGGGVYIYASAATDVVVDLQGYVEGPASGLGAGGGLYNPLPTPARICDTRAGNPSGLSGAQAQCNGTNDAGTTVPAGGTLTVQVTGAGGVPSSGVAAVVLNVTAVDPQAAGFLTVYPAGATQPTASNVNYVAGQVVPNRVIVPVSPSTSSHPGQIEIYSLAQSDVVVDVSGWYSSPSGTGTQFTPLAAPVRICDTRADNPSGLSGGAAQCNGAGNAGETLGSDSVLTVQVAGLASVPASAKAVVLNVTAVGPSQPTYLTVYPGGSPPTVSDLNPPVGGVEPNLVVATLSPTGTVDIYNAFGTVDVVVDVTGWYS